jgi:hypothetical protein
MYICCAEDEYGIQWSGTDRAQQIFHYPEMNAGMSHLFRSIPETICGALSLNNSDRTPILSGIASSLWPAHHSSIPDIAGMVPKHPIMCPLA